MKHDVKAFFVILCLLVLTTGAFASGKADGSPAYNQAVEENLSSGAETALSLRDEPIKYSQVIKTTYFDIIYPAQSERTARILADRVDALYEKAAAEFETEPWMHIPVIISPSTQIANAYYTGAPYNHIVILDTPCELEMYATDAESIVITFYHELIHAVTANIHKDPKYNKPFFLGDFYSAPFNLNTKLFIIEGATVSREGGDSEGRMNSGETLSMVIQAKLEGRFPEWKDIAGPLDVSPKQTGSYVFGGAFNWWLQNEYGMSRYADFWKECESNIGFTRIFKKIYGMTVDQAWQLFMDSVPVPEVETGIQRAEVEPAGRFLSMAYRPGDDNGVVYDKNLGTVVYRTIDSSGIAKERTLFDIGNYVNQFAFGSDGRYLAVSGMMTGTEGAFSVRIYDMENGCFTGAEIPFSRNAVITEDADGTQYVYCVESAACYEFATLYLLDDVLNTGSGVPKPLARTELPVFDEIFSTTAVPGGVACLRKTNGLWYLSIMNLDGSSDSWKFPEGYVPAGLTAEVDSSGKDMSFYTGITSRSMNTGSETEPGSLSRLGKITLGNGNANLQIQKKAFSGGVYIPTPAADGMMLSVSHLLQTNTMYSWSLADSVMSDTIALENCEPVQSTAEEHALAQSFTAEKYNPVKFMTRGTIFPIAGYPITTLSTAPMAREPGFTWWTENPQGTLDFSMTAGITTDFEGIYGADFSMSLFGSSEGLTGGNSGWITEATLLLDDDFSMYVLDLRALTTMSFPLRHKNETFNLTDLAVGHKWFNVITDAFEAGLPVYAVADTLSADYRYRVKKGMNDFSYNSFCLGVNFFYQYTVKTDNQFNTLANQMYLSQDHYAMPGLYASFELARLLPVPFYPRLTLNWPLSVNASLFCSADELLSADANITVFSAEIQKGIPFVPFYCNRFNIDVGCSFTSGAPTGYQFDTWSLFNSKAIFSQFNTSAINKLFALTGGMHFVVSPDIGTYYANHFNLGITANYYLVNDYSYDVYDITILGIIKL